MHHRLILLIVVLFIAPFQLVAQPIIHNTTDGIEFRNNIVSILISEEAELLSYVELSSGMDIAAHDHKKIARATKTGKASKQVSHVTFSDNLIHLYFGEDVVHCNVVAEDRFFTLEVVGGDIERFDSLVFLDFKLDYDFTATNPFLAAGVSMSLQTNPVYFPSGEAKEVIGQCYKKTGINGAKLAIIACRKNEMRDIIKEVYGTVPKGLLPVSYNGGGPFALDSEANKYDCVLISSVKPSFVPDWISFYSQFGIRQFEFMLGSTTFVQGDFTFPTFGSAEGFKEQITNPLLEAGIISTLHNYAYYLSYSSKDLLGDPKWQQQLEFHGDLTLAERLSTDAIDINVSGDKTCMQSDYAYRKLLSPFLLIDNEIIKYQIGAEGFVSCQRGQCGTKPTTHKLGARVRIIGGYYGHIAPQIGSELYYEIARRTAKAYNDGGFRGFYFDALSGLIVHLKYTHEEGFLWYYGASFINEVLKYCDRSPDVLDISDMYCTLWSSRGRGITYDSPLRGYKNHIDDHIKRNKTYMNRLYVTTLGWYNFYPTKNEMPSDYSVKYMFFDDVDYAGVKSIAYDQTMTYNGLSQNNVDKTPALKRNLDLFAQYSKLRQSSFFSDRVKEILREGRFEYKLQKRNNVWGFRQAVYCKEKIRDIQQDELIGNNPFKRQKPFIRLENCYTSCSNSSIVLLQDSSLVDLKENGITKDFTTPLDLSNHKAICVTAKGNGKDSKDAICVRLGASSAVAFADYIVRLNFDGWRRVIVSGLDNGEYPNLVFEQMSDDVSRTHQNTVDMSKVSYVKIYKTNDAVVSIQRVEAVPIVSNSLTNPTVHIGKTSVTFNDVIKSGEYIEYTLGNQKASVFDSIGDSRIIGVSRSGRPRIPKGDFSAYVSGIPEIENAPSEVILTLGLYGKFIHN